MKKIVPWSKLMNNNCQVKNCILFFSTVLLYSVTQNISIASHWFLKQLLKSVLLRRYKITIYPVTVANVPSLCDPSFSIDYIDDFLCALKCFRTSYMQ